MSDSDTKAAEIDRPLEEDMGLLAFEHADNIVPDCPCDRLAYSNGTLMAASFVSTATQIKAVRAILHAKRGKVHIRARGLSCQYPSRTNKDYHPRFNSPDMTPDDAGYNLWVQKLDYGKIHATVISKSRELIMYVSPESVWNRLMDSEYFETPLIREWMSYVTGKLIEKQYLRECRCFRANAAILEIKKREQLDEIVTDGLKSGQIQIP